jgi:hypothetical protein
MESVDLIGDGSSLFGILNIPSDNQIRNLLDEVDPAYVSPVFSYVFNGLNDAGYLDIFRSYNGNLLIALDGTQYFSSKSIHCINCNQKHHKNGTTTYSHTVITPVMVAPGNNKVISLQPEFITPQDGHKKQDCENAAAKRWIKQNAQAYKHLGITMLGDDSLYVNWCELTTTLPDGKVIYKNAFATNFQISKDNVKDIVEDGRARWKVENENILKTKGYNLEHNYGHGKKHLSSFLPTFNLPAFLFHTVLEITDKKYKRIRENLPTRKTFFDDIRALTRYIYVDNGNSLLNFMIRGLELGPPDTS